MASHEEPDAFNQPLRTMKRINTTLITLGVVITSASALAQERVFDFKGMRAGMSPTEFIAAVSSHGWEIPSYTTASGHSYFRRIDYEQLPSVDSLVDEILVDAEGFKLDCSSPGVTQCADVALIKASFAFGSLVRLELESGKGQEKVFKPYSIAAMKELDAMLGKGEKAASDIDVFFDNYVIDRTKLFGEVDIAHWNGVGASASHGSMPFDARVYAVRTTEKYDYHRQEKGIFLPWGICRIVVTQAPVGILEKWSAVKAQLHASK